MGTKQTIQVTVVYAPLARQVLEVQLILHDGCTAAEAIHMSGLMNDLTKVELSVAELGIWGRKVGSQHVLRDRDRVEIYRPLTVDPKVARRARFVRQGAKSAGLFANKRAGAKAGY